MTEFVCQSFLCRISQSALRKHPQLAINHSMVFKTFDSDIDKISAKWGMFGRSFNDIGTAIRDKIISFNEEFEQTGKIISSWKNSDSIWSRLYPSKEDIKPQLIDVDELIPKVDAKDFDFQYWIDELNKTDKGVKTGILSWQDYSNKLQDNQKWIAEWGQATEGQIRTQSDLIKANEAARTSALAQNAAIKAQTLSAKAGAVALKALSVAGNMILFAVATKSFEKIAEGIDKLSHSAERCKERVDGLMSSYQSALDTANSNAKTVEGLADRYDWSGY